MSIPFEKVVQAFDAASFGPPGETEGYLCMDTGQCFIVSEFEDDDEEAPDDLADEKKFMLLPDKLELDLGRSLVFEFAGEFLPDHLEAIHEIFRSKGAYGRFKVHLERNDLLQQWYDFESKRTEKALRQWCAENDLTLSG